MLTPMARARQPLFIGCGSSLAASRSAAGESPPFVLMLQSDGLPDVPRLAYPPRAIHCVRLGHVVEYVEALGPGERLELVIRPADRIRTSRYGHNDLHLPLIGHLPHARGVWFLVSTSGGRALVVVAWWQFHRVFILSALGRC